MSASVSISRIPSKEFDSFVMRGLFLSAFRIAFLGLALAPILAAGGGGLPETRTVRMPLFNDAFAEPWAVVEAANVSSTGKRMGPFRNRLTPIGRVRGVTLTLHPERLTLAAWKDGYGRLAKLFEAEALEIEGIKVAPAGKEATLTVKGATVRMGDPKRLELILVSGEGMPIGALRIDETRRALESVVEGEQRWRLPFVESAVTSNLSTE